MKKKKIVFLLLTINTLFIYSIDKKYIHLKSKYLQQYFDLIENVINNNYDLSQIYGEIYIREYKYYKNMKASKAKILKLVEIKNQLIAEIEITDNDYLNYIENYKAINFDFTGNFYDIKLINYVINKNKKEILISFRNGHWWYGNKVDFSIENGLVKLYNIPEKFNQHD